MDEPRDVRQDERLDAEKLQGYFREHLPDFGGELVIRQFPSGHSNLTYHLSDGTREWVLRRPPHGAQAKGGHDMHREYKLLGAVHPVWGKVPKPVLYCEDPAVMAVPFYVMERVRGVVLRGSKPKVPGLTPQVLTALSGTLVDTLAEIHGIDIHATGLIDLGKPEGYIQRQVSGWAARYEKAATHDVPEMTAAAAWLQEHRPADGAASLIHNDFRHDNVVLSPEDLTQVVAVLDWEMATVGDPLMDLGGTLAYWVDPDDPPETHMIGLVPTTQPGSLHRRDVLERYAQVTGRDLPPMVFYYVFGLFKLAVIAQQIYYRYHHGYTKDPRFAFMIEGVKVLGRMASLAVEKDRIDQLTK